MKLNIAFALFVSTMTIDRQFDVVVSSASVLDEADPPTTRKVCTAIIVSTFYILSTTIVTYFIFCFVCFLIPFVAIPLLLNTKTKSAKKDSSTPSSGITGQLGNSTFGSTYLRCPGTSDNYDCVFCDRGEYDIYCNFFNFIGAGRAFDMWASKVIDSSVSVGEDFIKPNSTNIMASGSKAKILFQASRHGTETVAKSFNLPQKKKNSLWIASL